MMPGLLTTMLLSASLFDVALPLVLQRETGILRRLQLTPVTAGTVVLGHGVTALLMNALTFAERVRARDEYMKDRSRKCEGRFPLLTDTHVRQSIIHALRSSGWEVARAVDLFGERNSDEELLNWAAANGYVLATCDQRIHRIAGSTRAVRSGWSSGCSSATGR